MAWAKTRLEIAPVTESPRAEQHPRGDGVKSVVAESNPSGRKSVVTEADIYGRWRGGHGDAVDGVAIPHPAA